MHEGLPQKLGRYRLLGPIGRGGMGEVQRAALEGPWGFSKLVALKLVRPEVASDPRFRDRFIEEARLMQRLSHANIVQVHDFGEDAGLSYLVLEYVEGKSLDALLRCTGALPPHLAAYILLELCRALDHAHGMRADDGRPLGLVHRDISPGNILIRKDGAVKLTDFGIARAEDRGTLTQPGMISGKVGYLSPEVLMGGLADARTDIFGLGVVGYQTLTGKNPFQSANIFENLRLLHEPVPPPSSLVSVPNALERMILRALASSPEERHPSARTWLMELELLLAPWPPSQLAMELAAALGTSPPRSLDAAAEELLGGKEAPRTAGIAAPSESPAARPAPDLFHLSPTPGSDPAASAFVRGPVLARGAWAVVALVVVGLAAFVLGPHVSPLPAPVALVEGFEPETEAAPAAPPESSPAEPAGQALTGATSGADAARPAPAAPPPSTNPPAEKAAFGRPKPRIQEKDARLRVNLVPWARVTVNGRYVGDTPLDLELRPGRHRVALSNPHTGQQAELDIAAASGDAVRIEAWP